MVKHAYFGASGAVRGEVKEGVSPPLHISTFGTKVLVCVMASHRQPLPMLPPCLLPPAKLRPFFGSRKSESIKCVKNLEVPNFCITFAPENPVLRDQRSRNAKQKPRGSCASPLGRRPTSRFLCALQLGPAPDPGEPGTRSLVWNVRAARCQRRGRAAHPHTHSYQVLPLVLGTAPAALVYVPRPR